MSIPKGSEVEAQAQSAGAVPSVVPAPCPGGDVPREGSRDIQKRGKIISVPYDWCKSTDSPVAYRIWAWQSSASNLANSVRQTDCRSHVMGSIVNECYGDEPGTGGGIKSGTNLAECTPLSASPTVRAEGRPMVRYLDKWHMNHGNTWGCLNNSEDMGRYDAPKVQLIDQKMMALAPGKGTQVAEAATLPMSDAAPAIPSPGDVGRAASRVLAPVGGALATPEAAAVGGAAGVGAGVGIGFGAAYGAHMNNMLTGPNLTAPGTTTPPSRAFDPSAPAPPSTPATQPQTEAQQVQQAEAAMAKARSKGKADAEAAAMAEIVRITLAQRNCPCTVDSYSVMRRKCPVECPNSQAHHIVPDYLLRFLSRRSASSPSSRIYTAGGQPLPSLAEGPSICLMGNAATPGTPHNKAQQWTSATIGGSAASGNGTVSLGYATDISVLGAVAARPECTAAILTKTYPAFDKFDRDTAVRGTIQKPSGDALNSLLGRPPGQE